jgi:hypothetical protein
VGEAAIHVSRLSLAQNFLSPQPSSSILRSCGMKKRPPTAITPYDGQSSRSSESAHLTCEVDGESG